MNFKKIYLVQGVIYINNIYINYIIFNWIKSVTYWNSRTGHLTPTVTSSGATGRTGGGGGARGGGRFGGGGGGLVGGLRSWVRF